MTKEDYGDCLTEYLKTAIGLEDFLTSNGRKVNREFTVMEFDTLISALIDYEDNINLLINELNGDKHEK